MGSLDDEDARKERRATLLAQLEEWTERPLTVLALLLIPLIMAPYLLELSNQTQDTLTALDYLIWGVFAAVLIAKVAIALDRGRYLLNHKVEVLLVALPMLRPLRATRVFSGVRGLRVVVAGLAAIRVMIGFRRIQAGQGVRFVLASGLIVVVVAGCMVTVLERNHPESNIRTLPDGLWWAVTTVTTVGYGDTFPHSSGGRGVGVALMLTGIGLFGVLTASLAALLLESNEDEVATQLREISERLRRLEERTTANASISEVAEESVVNPRR